MVTAPNRLKSIMILVLLCTLSQGLKSQFKDSLHIHWSFPAAEAHQGVAVDEHYFYAIGTRVIGKYDKTTGKKIGQWKDTTGEILHLDSGVEFDGKLYCAHSNYPALPMTSSVEVWDKTNLEHISSHSFGIRWGSFTWLDRHEGYWWAVFAHYEDYHLKDNDGNDPQNTDPQWTTLVKFDDQWQSLEEWIFPSTVIDRAKPYSISGGSWGADGLLYCSGHDRSELYVMQLPKSGSILKHLSTIHFPNEGQGIAWDKTKRVLYGIQRRQKRVIISAGKGLP